ncbi:hypothetical protein GCM10020331_001290 [Ectobacillus funiculus]
MENILSEPYMEKITGSSFSIHWKFDILLTFFTGFYLYCLHTGTAKVWLESIHHLGLLGIVIGIIIQTFVNVIPVPGEFVSLFMIEIYGPVAGGIYSWIGGIFRSHCCVLSLQLDRAPNH